MKRLNIKISLLIIIIGSLTIATSSCKKYLDKKSDASLIVPATLEDLQAILDDADKMNYSTSTFVEVASDDYFLLDATFNAQNTNNRDAYRWIPFDYNWNNEWAITYFSIYNSNLCLERLENIEKNLSNSEKWNNIKGSSLFFRSYYFLNLAWAYSKAFDSSTYQSDLGIPLRLNSNFNIPSVRGNVKETYERVIEDAKEAAWYLPDHPQHVMRPSKAAAYGLLARAYLTMRVYDSAQKYSDLCLQIKNQLIDFNGSSININSAAPFSRFNPETIFYSEAYPSSSLYVVYNYIGLVDSSVYSSYGSNDLRKTAFFSTQSGYQKFKGNYTQDYKLFSGIATDEMYLIRAESYARLGNKDAALADLNILLAKRLRSATFTPITAASAQEALGIIIRERRKELLFRGLRWIDIKRLNKEGAEITPKRIVAGQVYLLPPNDNRYALPLPRDIVDHGILQNPR